MLDTSVLIGDPGCLNSFAGVDVVIPFTVIEELDSLKTRPDDVGRAARTALRTIEEHRVNAGGSLAQPFAIGTPRRGTLQVEINGVQKHLLRRARPRPRRSPTTASSALRSARRAMPLRA